MVTISKSFCLEPQCSKGWREQSNASQLKAIPGVAVGYYQGALRDKWISEGRMAIKFRIYVWRSSLKDSEQAVVWYSPLQIGEQPLIIPNEWGLSGVRNNGKSHVNTVLKYERHHMGLVLYMYLF